MAKSLMWVVTWDLTWDLAWKTGDLTLETCVHLWHPLPLPSLHPGPCNSVGMRPRTDRHRRAWPQYISRRLRRTRNVMNWLNSSLNVATCKSIRDYQKINLCDKLVIMLKAQFNLNFVEGAPLKPISWPQSPIIVPYKWSNCRFSPYYVLTEL